MICAFDPAEIRSNKPVKRVPLIIVYTFPIIPSDTLII